MHKLNYKGRVEKRKVSKCEGVAKTYDKVQAAYLDVLESNPNVKEIRCNVVLNGIENGQYTTDFVCIKKDGTLMVGECIYRRLLSTPRNARLMDLSHTYWTERGVTDWGIVVDEDQTAKKG